MPKVTKGYEVYERSSDGLLKEPTWDDVHYGPSYLYGPFETEDAALQALAEKCQGMNKRDTREFIIVLEVRVDGDEFAGDDLG